MTAPFPIDFTTEAGRIFLNHHDWNGVACKAAVKATVDAILSDGYLKITSLNVARSGTVYIELQAGEYDAEYGDFGQAEIFDVRISDHDCMAGAYSHDGRTDNYTRPDFEISKDPNTHKAEIAQMIEAATSYFKSFEEG